MNFLRIKYFIEVCKTLNFTKAAQNLHLSQSSLSRQIQLLEEELATVLFIRDNRNVELTDTGRHFLHEIEPLIERIENLFERTKKMGNTKEIRIGFYQPSSISSFVDILDRLNQFYPEYSIRTCHKKAHELKQSYLSGEIDIILSSCYLELQLDDADRIFIGAEPISIIVNDEMPDRPSCIKELSSLNHKKLIIPDNELAPGCIKEYRRILDDLNISPSEIIMTNDLSWELLFKNKEDGFTITSQLFQLSHNFSSFIDIPKELSHFYKYAIWRKNTNLKLHEFFSTIEAACK